MGSWSTVSKSSRQTMNWGKRLAKLVQGGEIIGLIGELGAGKTCFVRGFAEGIGVGKNAWVRSPTFTLINEYNGRLPVYHIDLYRVSAPEQQEGLDLRGYLYGDGVSLIEWSDYLPAGQVDDYFEVSLTPLGGNSRELRFSAHGERYETMLKQLKVKNQK